MPKLNFVVKGPLEVEVKSHILYEDIIRGPHRDVSIKALGEAMYEAYIQLRKKGGYAQPSPFNFSLTYEGVDCK